MASGQNIAGLYHENAMIISNGGMGSVILLMPVMSFLERKFPKIGYFYQGHPVFQETGLDSICNLRNTKGYYNPNWRKFLPADVPDIFEFIKSRNITFVCDLRLRDPKDDEHFFHFRELATKKGIECWSLHDYGISTEMTRIYEKITKLFSMHGISLPQVSPAWLRGVYNPVQDDFKKTISIWLGTSCSCKRWDEQNWIDLIGWILNNTQNRIQIISGKSESEIEYASYIYTLASQDYQSNRLEFVHQKSLSYLLTMVAQSDFVITHDTFVTHFAAASAIPQIILYCSSDSRIWQPTTYSPISVVQSKYALDCSQMQINGICKLQSKNCDLGCCKEPTLQKVKDALVLMIGDMIFEKVYVSSG